jgi:hypothetical protein
VTGVGEAHDVIPANAGIQTLAASLDPQSCGQVALDPRFRGGDRYPLGTEMRGQPAGPASRLNARRLETGSSVGKDIEPGDQPRMVRAPYPLEAQVEIAERRGRT